MNFFLNGDFKIQQSWEKRSNESRNSKSRQRPKSRTNLKNNNSALYNAGKNMFEPSPDLLDDEVTKKILRDFQAQIPPPPSTGKSLKKIPMNDIDANRKLPPKSQKAGSVSSLVDDNLLTSMAARLKQLQLTTKSQRQEIKQKSQTNDKLRSQNEFLRGLRSDSSKVLKQMEDLKQKNEGLEKKIKQMQQYLKKYGVKWVGYNVQGKLDHQSLKNDLKKPKFNYRLPAEIDIGTIQRRVEQLNAALHSQGMGTEVYNENGVHKFRKAEGLPMGFFGNGIAIKGFKFFPYKSKESLQILSDLVDGYFPYVLKHKHPNGVFLTVVDKITQKYDDSPDRQQKIITNFDQIANKDFLPPTKQQFLNKLPKQVIKNGKVIEIRKAIQNRLNGNQTIKQEDQNLPECDVSPQGHNIFLTTCYQDLKSQKNSPQSICTLKIRTSTGQICILHLQKQSLISDVYKWMQKVIPLKKFQLMGNYPHRTYSKHQTDNLQELGLFPNAMLHIHEPQTN